VTDVLDEWLRAPDPAVIFDFNGTLSDDEPILFDIFGALFGEHLGWTMTAAEYRSELLGRSDREIVEYAVTRHGHGAPAQVDDLLRLRQREYQARARRTTRSPKTP
jgi:beta-phosphoglucomutase-like phosphatase (HAD superfamily)